MKCYGLIGYPLGHSFSRQFFTGKFSRENIPEQYLNFEIRDLSLLESIILENEELAGLNVTIPYKEKVLPLLDWLDPVAEATGAVNTIRIERCSGNILLKGFNTDVFGFTGSLAPLLKPGHTHALVLGTGGASKAVCYALKQLGISFLMVSRSRLDENTIGYEALDKAIMARYTLIINATPVGTAPDCDGVPPVPFRYVTPGHLLFDLVYNPPETRFLAGGKEKGAVTRNGYEMLVLQALKAYELWNGNQ